MKNRSDLILSICIPTYNRGTMLYNNVKKILEYDGNDIEIVVIDNASTDDTWKLLQTVRDVRLRLIKNDVNMGAEWNFCYARLSGKGQYTMCLTDRDCVRMELIKPLLLLIKERKYEYVMAVSSKDKSHVVTLKDKMFYEFRMHNHPGEIIYNTCSLQNYARDEFIRKSSKEEMEAKFFKYIYKGICSSKGFWYNHQLIKSLSENRFSRLTQQRREAKPYFEPESCFICTKKWYESFSLSSENQRTRLIFQEVYRAGLEKSTFEYLSCINSRYYCKRYHFTPPRHICWLKVNFQFMKWNMDYLRNRKLLTSKMFINLLFISINNYLLFIKDFFIKRN